MQIQVIVLSLFAAMAAAAPLSIPGLSALGGLGGLTGTVGGLTGGLLDSGASGAGTSKSSSLPIVGDLPIVGGLVGGL
jgi:hypothetical protein